MKKQNNQVVEDKDINTDPNQDLSLLDKEVKEVEHDIKDDYILEVKNLKMYFPISTSLFKTVPLKAVDNVSFKIRRGETLGLVGESGCGKTTLLNIIGLLDRASFGSYFLNGEPVDRLSGKKKAKLRAGNIGFIFQDFNLIPTINILDNVTLPLVYTGYGKTRREKTADEILERFHLRSKEYYMPSQLSGGQKQRVAIARSLISDPEIILADEPTGNLDSRSAHIVMEELKTIHSEGNTIIMVTHNPALTVYATRVINMLDGHIDTDVKTVRDQDLPQPISVRIAKKITLKTDDLTSKIDEAANQKSQKESA